MKGRTGSGEHRRCEVQLADERGRAERLITGLSNVRRRGEEGGEFRHALRSAGQSLVDGVEDDDEEGELLSWACCLLGG